MAPPMLRAPLVVLAAAASVIASQAVISGAYSLSQQGILLGIMPRMTVTRTSETQSGQIFMPQVNRFLMVGVLVLVAVFQTADNLADAYGLAVTGTMLTTTILAYIVVRRMWKWRFWQAALMIAPLIVLDSTFLLANGLKIASGGWLPLSLGLCLFVIMYTWMRGTRVLTEKTRRESVPVTELIEMLRARQPHRVPGTAIFLTSDPDTAPVALMHNLKHNKVLHAKNVIATVRIAETPRVADCDRGADHRLQRGLQEADHQLRLHGDAQCAQGAGAVPAPGSEVRHHGHLLLPRAAICGAGGPDGHAPVAGQAVHLPAEERLQSH